MNNYNRLLKANNCFSRLGQLYLKSSYFLVLFLIVFSNLQAQIIPGEGAKLNYRIIGFSASPLKDAVKYSVEIADTQLSDVGAFQKHITARVSGQANKLVAEVSSFGRQYTWRMVATMANKKIIASDLHHFSTISSREIDTLSGYHLRILVAAKAHKDDYIFVDANNTLYDMMGHPVWYLPINPELQKKGHAIRDLRITPQGTLTYLHNNSAQEVNYNGDTIWTAPKTIPLIKTDSDNYHHEFTRFANGHYMAMGIEHVMFDHYLPQTIVRHMHLPNYNPETDTIVSVTDKCPFGTLKEFDENGKLIWTWKSSAYFLKSDLCNYLPESGKRLVDVHMNSFYFDEQERVIYLSFKDISRVLKIKYPSGEVLSDYGEKFRKGKLPVGNGLFCDQHCCKKTGDNLICLYNNNVCSGDSSLPQVVMLKEPADGKGELEKVWEYQCTKDDIKFNDLNDRNRKMYLEATSRNRKYPDDIKPTSTGGSVTELSDKSILVSMNAQYPKMFLINRNKEILWSAVPEKWSPNTRQWQGNMTMYKSCLITRNELEHLIWSANK